LWILTIPFSSAESLQQTEGAFLTHLQNWVEAGAARQQEPQQAPSQMMTFQGAQILWAAGRCAILSQPERLISLRSALIEVFYYEAELRDIEQTLGTCWPALEADMPLAFEVDQLSMGKRQQLRQRFQQTLLLRARMAKISPHVHCPHLHPPTLASQVGERVRERTRMEHRYEFLDEQVEVFEQVYEMCGERASDFMLTRSGNILELLIIVLLLFQLLLSGFEMLTSVGT
jgi:hypothetical protein